MKATESFTAAIAAYIDREKQADPLFAKSIDEQPKKDINACVNYILKEVRKSGINGWADEEIFSMAKHFFDERDLKDPGPMKNVRVIVNHHVELSDEEKAAAREKAAKEYQEAELNKLKAKAQREHEKAIRREKEKTQALLEKRERESKMQLSLFG